MERNPPRTYPAARLPTPTQYVYSGMLITVSNAGSDHVPTFRFRGGGWVKQTHSVTFSRMTPGSLAANGGPGYVWAARKSTAADGLLKDIALSFGVQYLVIDVGDIANSNCWIFVNPPAGLTGIGDLTNNMTADAWDSPSSGGAGEDTGTSGGTAEGAGGWIWGQFGQTLCQPGLPPFPNSPSRRRRYAAVYNFLTNAVAPPPANPFVDMAVESLFTVSELGTPSFSSGPNADPFGRGDEQYEPVPGGSSIPPTRQPISTLRLSRRRIAVRMSEWTSWGPAAIAPTRAAPASRTNVLEFTAGNERQLQEQQLCLAPA